MRVRAYRNYFLILLMTILAFNNADRLTLGIVLQDVQKDLLLSDTQLGLLTGIAFSLFYAVMGIPIARWADRGNRATIIAVTTLTWSVAVALCGTAKTFLQLILIRIAAAVGEAGCLPPAHSLIADTFPRAERPRAVARYMIGGPVALTIGYFAAGWLNQFLSWRKTFLIVGAPGLLLAILAYLTLKDPRESIKSNVAPELTIAAEDDAQTNIPLKEVWRSLWSNAAFRHLVICYSVWAFFGVGILQWQPTFFIRSFGLRTGELGSWFAFIHGVCGGLGIYLGGEWAARYAANNERRQLNACAVAFIFFAFLNAAAYLVPLPLESFGLLALAAFGGNMVQGPFFATVQTLIEPPMRAMSIALMLFFSNLIGNGLGPLAAGVMSDAMRGRMGQDSLRYALVVLCPGYFWAAWHLWRASQAMARTPIQ